MYTISVKRDFTAYHYLIGGNWGAENERHAHQYAIELRLEGEQLDQHGYLVDIVNIESLLNDLVLRYENKTLNDLKEFDGLNPSIENFSRILCKEFVSTLKAQNIKAVRIKIWENDIACASYRQEI
jgi:6-pyruvoyltetrahydropterin/6-carboxytetrahydropterin synthase